MTAQAEIYQYAEQQRELARVIRQHALSLRHPATKTVEDCVRVLQEFADMHERNALALYKTV